VFGNGCLPTAFTTTSTLLLYNHHKEAVKRKSATVYILNEVYSLSQGYYAW